MGKNIIKADKFLPIKKNRSGTKRQLRFFLKGDMNFWLVMLVIALIFMVVVFFVMDKVFDFFGESTGKIQGDIEKQQKESSIFEGLGTSDSSSDDKEDTSTNTES